MTRADIPNLWIALIASWLILAAIGVTLALALCVWYLIGAF